MPEGSCYTQLCTFVGRETHGLVCIRPEERKYEFKLKLFGEIDPDVSFFFLF